MLNKVVYKQLPLRIVLAKLILIINASKSYFKMYLRSN